MAVKPTEAAVDLNVPSGHVGAAGTAEPCAWFDCVQAVK